MAPGAKHMNNENHETNLPGGDRRLSDRSSIARMRTRWTENLQLSLD